MSGLHSPTGARKYLNRYERAEFIAAAQRFPREERAFCQVLHATGCRISEALALTGARIDFKNQALVFETLKKRRRGVFRSVPVSPALLDTLNLVFNLRGMKNDNLRLSWRLWRWSRATAWRRVRSVMADAEIFGPQASAKGLRHGYGVAAVSKSIPPNLIQRWMGHAQLSTTAIYLDAVGTEERAFAARMWDDE